MNRREFFTLTATASLVAAALKPEDASGADRRDFVLVHGAFHGGWCWGPVAEILRSHGNRVFTPTFTGVGERAHLMSPAIDLNTFIRDITIEDPAGMLMAVPDLFLSADAGESSYD